VPELLLEGVTLDDVVTVGELLVDTEGVLDPDRVKVTVTLVDGVVDTVGDVDGVPLVVGVPVKDTVELDVIVVVTDAVPEVVGDIVPIVDGEEDDETVPDGVTVIVGDCVELALDDPEIDIVALAETDKVTVAEPVPLADNDGEEEDEADEVEEVVCVHDSVIHNNSNNVLKKVRLVADDNKEADRINIFIDCLSVVDCEDFAVG
jgi:hypothetical protein